VDALIQIAETFFHLQESRHLADYDNSSSWTRTEALQLVNAVEDAFRTWEKIRTESAAQEYLLALLVRRRG
jgi:hypothetical protein